MLNHKNSRFPYSGGLLLHSGPNHPFHSLPVLQGGLLSIMIIYIFLTVTISIMMMLMKVFRHEEEVGSYIEGRGNFADENAMQFRGRSSSW